MAAKRIYQLAKEFECDEKKIIDFLTAQGIKVANRLSAVSDDTYTLLKTTLFAPPPEPEPEPEPAPPSPPKVEEPAQAAQTPAESTEETPAPVQGGGKKKKKKKKKAAQGEGEQTEEGESQEQEEKINVQVNFDLVNAATQAVSASSLVAGNDFLKSYLPFNRRKSKETKTALTRNMDVWGLLQYLVLDDPDSSPIRYWEAVNKLTTAAYKLAQEYGLRNRDILGEMREVIKPVGAKYEPQEIFTDEENQKFAAQQKFLFDKFGHGMGAINDNLYELKMYAERKKLSCERMSFVDYLTKPDNMLETKIPMPFMVLAETVAYGIRSLPSHVSFYKENKDRIIKIIENFFAWIDGYKKLKEQGADAAKLEKYLDLEQKFFNLVEFMSFDNLVSQKKKDKPVPFEVALDLLNEYRDNMDDPDAKRNFQYKVRGITNIIYKPKEYVFLFQFAELEPGKDYRTPEMIAAAEAAKAAAEAEAAALAEQEKAAEEQENPAEESGEAE